jgi:hypothetical protein
LPPTHQSSTSTTTSDDQTYVDIASSQYGGQLDPETGVFAPLYYAVQEHADAVEISYLFLYAFHGGQTVRPLSVIHQFDCILHTWGEHQGDLERVVVTLVPVHGESTNYRVLRVGYESHGDVSWYGAGRVPFEGTHPVVHVALNGHSNHNLAEQGERVIEEEVPCIVAVTSNLAPDGQVWRPQESDLRQLGLDASGAPINDQLWAAYRGRLGVEQTDTFQSATYFDGSGLDTLDWVYVFLVARLTQFLGLLPSNVTDGNGPVGPGARDWVRQPAAGITGR